jgi:rhodanese-related sulfurtransferase
MSVRNLVVGASGVETTRAPQTHRRGLTRRVLCPLAPGYGCGVPDARDRSAMTVDELLDAARASLPQRLSPHEAARALGRGALLVDIRGDDQRRVDGLVPGATAIPRNVLEWRCDPSSPWRHGAVRDHDQELVLLCNEGFQSSLAAATLQQLGMRRATDVVGGFVAWREAGLPVVAFEEA